MSMSILNANSIQYENKLTLLCKIFTHFNYWIRFIVVSVLPLTPNIRFELTVVLLSMFKTIVYIHVHKIGQNDPTIVSYLHRMIIFWVSNAIFFYLANSISNSFDKKSLSLHWFLKVWYLFFASVLSIAMLHGTIHTT